MESLNYSKAHIDKQRSATEALLKFCNEHEYNVESLEAIRLCLAALEKSDIKSAIEHYQK